MTTYSNERMLVFAPHHDDAEFGIGGWLNRMIEEQVGVARVVVACGGDYRRSDGRIVTGGERRIETFNAMEHLGVKDFVCKDWFPENCGAEMPHGTLVGLIEEEIEAYQPTEVFVCLPGFNQDHTALHDAVITAMRPGHHTSVVNLWTYEYPGTCWGTQAPNYGRCYIGLQTRHALRKIEALRMHKSQWEGRHTRGVTPDGALTLMNQRGNEAGLDYAECVYLMREINR